MNNISFLIISFCFSFTALGALCDGKSGKPHTNPDNSIGGFVADTAKVSTTSFIDPSSSVCDQVQVIGSVRVMGDSILSEKAILEGRSLIEKSFISGSARISGSSVISNSKVCQMAQISGFNVINSDYYCQTGDPTPKDPGPAEDLSVLGVDSDSDGVRDDVEILINNLTTNTPSKDYKEIRFISKEYAKIVQKEILHRENKLKLKELLLQKVNILACGEVIHEKQIFEQIYDTEERLYALFKISGSFHGEEVVKTTRKCTARTKSNSIK